MYALLVGKSSCCRSVRMSVASREGSEPPKEKYKITRTLHAGNEMCVSAQSKVM